MENNNATSPPEIKKNLFKLNILKINKLIPNITFQAKAINESKLRNKKNLMKNIIILNLIRFYQKHHLYKI